MRKRSGLFLLYLLIFGHCNGPSPDTSRMQTETPDTLTATGKTLERPADQATVEKTFIIPIDYDTTQWTEVIRLDSSIHLDLKYATADNFVNEKMYDCGRCFLRPEVARAVVWAHRQLQNDGYGLKMLDCYRPHSVQWKLWEKMPDPRYVTDPQKGSMHNRGAAVDLTLVDSLGRELDMGAPFDHFGWAAYHAYPDLPDSIRMRRQLLKSVMETGGFRAIRTEWWHYSYQETFYALSDMLWKCYE